METNNKSSKFPVIIVSILAVFAIAAASAFGFLYFNEKSKPNEVVTQTITKTKTEPSSDLPSSVNLLTTKQAEEKYAGGKNDKAINYSTDIGKFNLSLPSSLGVVQEFSNKDANGAQTLLKIGKRTGSLITYPSITPFSFHAIQVDEDSKTAAKLGSGDSSTAYQYLVENYGITEGSEQLKGAKETKVSIAGQEAIDYEVTGMFTMHYVVFHKNDLLYVLSYDDEDESNDEILKLINKSLELKS